MKALLSKVKAAERYLLLSFCLLSPILGRSGCAGELVSFQCTECTVEEAFEAIDQQISCSFSFNPTQFPLDSIATFHIEKVAVREALTMISGRVVKTQQKGRHLLITSSGIASSSQKNSYEITGYVRDAITGREVSKATVYLVDGKFTALTDEQGYYRLKVEVDDELLGLSYSKQQYLDTIILVKPAERVINQSIHLRPTERDIEKIPLKGIESPKERKDVETLPMVKLLVPEVQRSRAINLEFLTKIPVQFSVIPRWGTNKFTSGFTENTFSLNLFSGYNAGLKGAEIGGLVNILRYDAKGLQTAGVGNIVGGRVKGLQASGIFNNVRGSVNGLQLAGIYNLVLDTIEGVQGAGVFNILRGSIDGAQLAGVFNIATKDMSGMQAAGLFNITNGEVYLAQLGGLFNTAGTVSGVQVAGLFNQADSTVVGHQISGGFNSAGNIDGNQLSSILNMGKRVGVQIGMVNVADTVTGFQLGLVNFNDSCANSYGLLSFSKSGFHHFDFYADDLHYFNAAFRTGTDKFHNIFTLGLGSYYGLRLRSWGYGIGRVFPAKVTSRYYNAEITARTVRHRENERSPLNLDIAIALSHHWRVSKEKPFTVFVAPSFHMLLSTGQLQNTDPDAGEILEVSSSYPPIYEQRARRQNFRFWPGVRAGIRF